MGHLGYASTAYGVQGITADSSHTVLNEAINAAGLYVGLTRGTHHNTLHFMAQNDADAREQFLTAMRRDRADRGLDAATLDARDALRGIVKDGSVALVNAERTRLQDAIRNAEKHVRAWDQAITALRELRQRHEAEREDLDKAAIIAEQAATDIRAGIVKPLIADATEDAGRYHDAEAETHTALRAHDDSGWLRKPATARLLREAQQHQRVIAGRVWARWGSPPPDRPEAIGAWAEGVADRHAAADPRVTDAQPAAAEAQTAASSSVRRHLDQRMRAHASFFAQIEGPQMQPHRSPGAHRDSWYTHYIRLQEELNEIETVPTEQAAHLIRTRWDAAQSQAQRAREWTARLGVSNRTGLYRNDPDHGIHR